jgi:hypothetical protein
LSATASFNAGIDSILLANLAKFAVSASGTKQIVSARPSAPKPDLTGRRYCFY